MPSSHTACSCSWAGGTTWSAWPKSCSRRTDSTTPSSPSTCRPCSHTPRVSRPPTRAPMLPPPPDVAAAACPRRRCCGYDYRRRPRLRCCRFMTSSYQPLSKPLRRDSACVSGEERVKGWGEGGACRRVTEYCCYCRRCRNILEHVAALTPETPPPSRRQPCNRNGWSCRSRGAGLHGWATRAVGATRGDGAVPSVLGGARGLPERQGTSGGE